MNGSELALSESMRMADFRFCTSTVCQCLLSLLKASLLAWLVFLGAAMIHELARHKRLLCVMALCLTFFFSQMALAQSVPAEKLKSKTAAYTYSLATTLVPEGVSILYLVDALSGEPESGAARTAFVLGLLGPVIGPGVGHAYAGNTARFRTGILIRGSAAAVGTAILFTESTSSFGMASAACADLCLGVLIVASMAYDIASVSKSVDQYNQERGLSKIELRPHYLANHKAVGIVLSAKF